MDFCTHTGLDSGPFFAYRVVLGSKGKICKRSSSSSSSSSSNRGSQRKHSRSMAQYNLYVSEPPLDGWQRLRLRQSHSHSGKQVNSCSKSHSVMNETRLDRSGISSRRTAFGTTCNSSLTCACHLWHSCAWLTATSLAWVSFITGSTCSLSLWRPLQVTRMHWQRY